MKKLFVDHFHIQGISEPVAGKHKRKHREHDGNTGNDGKVG